MPPKAKPKGTNKPPSTGNKSSQERRDVHLADARGPTASIPRSKDDGDDDLAGTHRKRRHDATTNVNHIVTRDVGTQPRPQSHMSVQAEPPRYKVASVRISEDSIRDFLQRVTPMVMQALQENRESDALRDWTPHGDEHSQELALIAQLNEETYRDLHIAELTWNATGNLLAVAYGHMEHEDWCRHRAGIGVWNATRLQMGQHAAQYTIDTTACLTTISFNPKSPTLLAAGACTGEVFVWDLERDDSEKLLATSGMIPTEGHREPVSRVVWVLKEASHAEAYQLLSCSTDGKVILWKKPAGGGTELHPHAGILLNTDDVMRCMSFRGAGGSSTLDLPLGRPVGVCSMAYTREDNGTFVIGSENGLVLRCRRTALREEVSEAHSYSSAYARSYARHAGPITDMCVSRLVPSVLLSVSTDGEAKLHHESSSSALIQLQPAVDESLLACDCSPSRPGVFAVTTSGGMVQFFDLMRNLTEPVAHIRANALGVGVDTFRFNPKQTRLAAAGDRTGSVYVWRLPSLLCEQQFPNERHMFDYFVRERLA